MFSNISVITYYHLRVEAKAVGYITNLDWLEQRVVSTRDV